MTVVLQSLLHNPLLRNYFLSDCHNPHRCARRMRLVSSQQPPTSNTVCLACDMDELFSTFFSGDHAPFLPDHFLYSMWTYAEHLAGYAQQDAHELLMSIMDGIHSSCIDQTPASFLPSAGSTHLRPPHPCRCIIHTVFGGTLRSDVTCSKCHTNSTALDDTLDLSLDITPIDSSGATANSNHRSQTPMKITDCLTKFTHVEKLSHNQFFCSKVRGGRGKGDAY